MVCIVSRSHTHPSHCQTSRHLSSSLSWKITSLHPTHHGVSPHTHKSPSLVMLTTFTPNSNPTGDQPSCHGESRHIVPVSDTIPVSVIPLEEYLRIFLCVLEISTLCFPTMMYWFWIQTYTTIQCVGDWHYVRLLVDTTSLSTVTCWSGLLVVN